MNRTYRRISQAICLALFILIIIVTSSPYGGEVPAANLFIRLSPHLALPHLLSGSSPVIQFVPALILMLLTALFGRFFCGWVCPLGTAIDTTDKLFKTKTEPDLNRLRKLKYVLLLASVIVTSLGVQLAGLIDPLTIAFRTFGLSLFSFLAFAVSRLLKLLYLFPDLYDALETPIQYVNSILPEKQPVFDSNFLILAVFFLIIAAGVITRRFWCRYLCPLGAVLALVSSLSPMGRRLAASCNHCAACEKTCRMSALNNRGGLDHAGECIECQVCGDLCKPAAIKWWGTRHPALPGWKPATPLLERRIFLQSLAAAALVYPAFKLSGKKYLIRPPGAVAEDQFTGKCIRCGACMKVCPTNALQPALGVDTLWTPQFVMRSGPCEYNCNDCGRICPTGAIQNLPLEIKKKTVVGLAEINRNRCLPWLKGSECLVCEEFCPVPVKAIVLREEKFRTAAGESITVKLPYVVEQLCNGCGKCEHACPTPEASVTVVPVEQQYLITDPPSLTR